MSENALPCLDVKCSLEAAWGWWQASSGLWLKSAQSRESAVELNKAISQSGELEAKAVAGSQRAIYVADGWGNTAGTQRWAEKHLSSVSTSAVSHRLAWCLWLIRGPLWSKHCLENNCWFLSWCLNVSLFLAISFCPSFKCCLLWD